MLRSLRLYQDGSQAVALDINSTLEFTLRHDAVNASSYDVPYYYIYQKNIPYLGVDDREYLLFHSEEDANITVLQPIMSGECKDGVIWNAVTPPTDLVDGALLYSYDYGKYPDSVQPPALTWFWDEYNSTFHCDDAVEGEDYVLYLVTSICAKAGCIPMARRIEENIEVDSPGIRYTTVFCDGPAITSFYFGADAGRSS